MTVWIFHELQNQQTNTDYWHMDITISNENTKYFIDIHINFGMSSLKYWPCHKCDFWEILVKIIIHGQSVGWLVAGRDSLLIESSTRDFHPKLSYIHELISRWSENLKQLNYWYETREFSYLLTNTTHNTTESAQVL